MRVVRRRLEITDKRLSDRRFKKTEEAILQVFFRGDSYVSMDEMAKKAGVSRSTIYRHHDAVKYIIPDYERYILNKYRRNVNRVLRDKKTRAKDLYTALLLFMMKNKRVFRILIRGGSQGILVRMIRVIRLKIGRELRLPLRPETALVVYMNEVAVLIEGWAGKGFLAEEMDEIIREVMYLTETAKVRLIALNRESKDKKNR